MLGGGRGSRVAPRSSRGVAKGPMLLPKTKTVRDEDYLAWLRVLPCAFCAAPSPSEPSHHGPGGTGLKASDHLALPACRRCHQRFHTKGSPHPRWDALTRDEKRERFAKLAAEYQQRKGIK